MSTSFDVELVYHILRGNSDEEGRGGATGGGLGRLEPPPVGDGLPPVGEFKDFSRGWVGYDFH